ncbi:bestrophin family ion channel [Flammeovirga sp. SubArs3]|uniref:bestrophin family protein n=1 Tax=Flammeovirga sp. SubArs3 TaxID=2995316 RepID=UPI00248D1C68|nr:bestrophin family ion channel [Flammeovirga sp. SubArs3]
MYTQRNYSIGTMALWTRRYIYMFLFISAIPTALYVLLDWKFIHLPWLPIALIGSALAFIIGFKNNASYGRLWEARKIWGGIVNTSRSFTIMVNDFISNQYADNDLSQEELFAIRKTIILRHIAWMTCLRHALRTPKPWEMSHINASDKEYMDDIVINERKYTLKEELTGYLSEEEIDHVLSQGNKQSACLNLQSKHLRALQEDKRIWEFSFLEMEKQIIEMFALQGKSERIKNFPYPRQFATLNRFFVWIFVLLLPIGLINVFDEIGLTILKENSTNWYGYLGNYFAWLTIPFSIVISWIFFTMERIGEVSENPFEGVANDVPITTMARGIEIDIRQMIGDNKEEIPSPIEHQRDIQM